MGTICTVINSFNSGIAVGTRFKSKRDAARALPMGIGMKVGLQAGDETFQFRRTEKMIFVEPLGRIVGSPATANSSTSPGPRRPVGRTSWEVTASGDSGVTKGQTFNSRNALVTAMKLHSTLTAKDMATGKLYRIELAGRTYRIIPV